MIINRDESEITVLGDVQKFKVGIDERNINHIVTILSSNLYSHPMQSFLRETVSNAVDSHIEAGVDEPIIITITDTDISIRDYGTGISPERFQEIYTNIGSSTKRESNEYIGSFGIGRFSALSVSALVNVTSFYNGKASYYVMNKDIDQLHVDLLYEKDTAEPNGVEVKIPFSKDNTLDHKDWKCLGFIDNVYIQEERHLNAAWRPDYALAEAFNKRKIHTFKSFKYLGIEYPFSNDTSCVLVGNIPYEVNLSTFMDSAFCQDWKAAFQKVCPCVRIGEVDVTPNREGLLYSERTKRVLEKAYLDTAAELSKMFSDQCNEEKTTFSEYLSAMTMYDIRLVKIGNDGIRVSDKLPKKIKYHGFEDLDQKRIESILRTFKNLGSTYLLAVLDGNVLTRKFKTWYWDVERFLADVHDTNKVYYIIPDAVGMSSQYFKPYIQEKHGDRQVVFLKNPLISVGSVKRFIRDHYGISFLASKEEVHIIIKVLKEALKEIGSNSIIEDFMESQEYKDYKTAHKVKKVYRKDTTKISVHVYNPIQFSGEITYTDTVDSLIHKLKRDYDNPRMVYASLDSPFIQAVRELSFPKLIILGLSKGNYKAAANGLFPDWIKPIESLYSCKERYLRRLATFNAIRQSVARVVNFVNLPSYFPEPLREKSKEFVKIVNNMPHITPFSSYRSFIDLVDKEDYDLNMLALWHDLKDAFILNTDRFSMNDFTIYVLMKHKKFRPNIKEYNRIRERINDILK